MLLTALIFFSFFAFGFTEYLRGPTLPLILDEFSLRYAQGGVLFLALYAGFLAAVIGLGMVSDRKGRRLLIVTGGVCISASLLAGQRVLGPYIINSYFRYRDWISGVWWKLHYPRSLSKEKGRISQLPGAVSWRRLYDNSPGSNGDLRSWGRVAIGLSGGALFGAVLLVASLAVKGFKPVQRAESDKPATPLFTKRLLLFYLFLGFAVGTEVGIASWMVAFLERVKSISITRASFYLSLYYGLMIAGRIGGRFFFRPSWPHPKSCPGYVRRDGVSDSGCRRS